MTQLIPPIATTDRSAHALDRHGYVRDWLTAPAWSTPCDDLHEVLDATGSPWGEHGRWVLTNGPDVAPLKQRLYERHPLALDQQLPQVLAGGKLSWQVAGTARTAVWTRSHTGADGLLDWSEFCFTPEYRHAVAATALEVDQAEYRTLEIGCTGPAALFVAGELAALVADFTYMEPYRHQVRVRLRSGLTAVHLVTWQVAFRECRHIASLRVFGLPVRVVLPEPGANETRAATAESMLDAVGLRPWATTDGTVTLTGPVGARYLVGVDGAAPQEKVVLTDGTARFALPGAQAGESAGNASMLVAGERLLSVRVDDPAAPVVRQLRAARVPAPHRADPLGADPAVWRAELLRHVAGDVPGVARALARHALDPAAPVADDDLAPPLAMIDTRSDCADFEAVGLVHLWRRLNLTSAQRDRVRTALLGFKYWIDQPGLDAMCYFTENHQFVWHTSEALIGAMFPDDRFGNTGWLGQQHAEHGSALAADWMRRKLDGGFSEFDSNAYLAIDSFALVSWIEFAGDDGLRRVAEALLDKVFLTLAANSWRGVHGAAHGRSYVRTLRSSRFEETAPIMWAQWGAGALNAASLPATALATATQYRMPDVIRSIATELPDEWDGRQVYRGRYRLHHDLLERPYESDLRVWRTPDAMLSSVQDYRSGLPGLQEHVWGATLGPETQVFATHPATDSTSSSARPNAWAGHRVLPRVRQHRDSLLVLHRIPEPDWLGSTHLWFPTPHMDEYLARRSWLAGRVGDGFVAVAAAGGFRPHTTGDEAGQTWLPLGDGRAYVATVGRAAADGSFADFVAGLAEPAFGPESVSWRARDGRVLALAWPGAFTVNGVAATDFEDDTPHLSNPAVRAAFGADRLDASWRGRRLVLDLANGRRLEPASAVAGEADHVGR